MAVQFKDGVVIGADSRTTTGSYIVGLQQNQNDNSKSGHGCVSVCLLHGLPVELVMNHIE